MTRHSLSINGEVEFIKLLKSRARWILLTTVLGACAAAIYSKYQPKEYAYVGLLQIGQVTELKNQDLIHLPIALSEDIKAFLSFYYQGVGSAAGRIFIDPAKHSYLESAESTRGSNTLMRLSARAGTLQSAKSALEVVLETLQRHYAPLIEWKRKIYQEHLRNIDSEILKTKAILDGLDVVFQNANQDKNMRLIIGGRRFEVSRERERLEGQRSLYVELISPIQSYNFSYLDLKAQSELPVAPHSFANVLLGAILGFASGLFIILLRHKWSVEPAA